MAKPIAAMPKETRRRAAREPMPGWNVRASGGVHRVELGRPSLLVDVPRKFTCDGIEHSLGPWWRMRKSVSFEVSGRRATISTSGVYPPIGKRFRRAFGAERRGLPGIVLAFLLGGSGFGGGAVGASLASSILVMWRYELLVDGKSRGTWVATLEGGEIKSWRFFVAGRELPDFAGGRSRRQSATGPTGQGSLRRSIGLGVAGAFLVGVLDYSPAEYEGLAFAGVLVVALIGGLMALTWSDLLGLVVGAMLGGTASSLSQLGQANGPSSAGASLLGAAAIGVLMVLTGGAVFVWRHRSAQTKA